MLASELYARVMSRKCSGPERCHWCDGPCGRELFHDDPIPLPFSKLNPAKARRWTSPYQCIGCWLWRRQRVSVHFIDGTIIDRQTASAHSWLVTDEALAVKPDHQEELLRVLTKPPCTFCLALLDAPDPLASGASREENQLHLAVVNDIAVIKAETELKFTLNNVPYVYTIYELEQAVRYGPSGTRPGVQALLRWMGPIRNPPPLKESQTGRKYRAKVGQPFADPAVKATVTMSGVSGL